MRQKLQLFILKALGESYLILNHYDFAIECLENSFKTNPKDIEITKGEVVDKIKKQSVFRQSVDRFIKDSGKQKSFSRSENINFEDGDLFNALHGTTLIINGKKTGSKWHLDIIITDVYDFTELTKIQDYIKEGKNPVQSFAAAFGNNVALIATSCNVVHKYNITIKFSMEYE